MTDLKPCPFCGEKAEAEVWEPCDDYPGNQFLRFTANVHCIECRLNGPSRSIHRYKTRDEALSAAVTAWNTRKDIIDEPEKQFKAMEAHLEAIARSL